MIKKIETSGVLNDATTVSQLVNDAMKNAVFDKDLGSISALTDFAMSLKGVNPANIQFMTLPGHYSGARVEMDPVSARRDLGPPEGRRPAGRQQRRRQRRRARQPSAPNSAPIVLDGAVDPAVDDLGAGQERHLDQRPGRQRHHRAVGPGLQRPGQPGQHAEHPGHDDHVLHRQGADLGRAAGGHGVPRRQGRSPAPAARRSWSRSAPTTPRRTRRARPAAPTPSDGGSTGGQLPSAIANNSRTAASGICDDLTKGFGAGRADPARRRAPPPPPYARVGRPLLRSADIAFTARRRGGSRRTLACSSPHAVVRGTRTRTDRTNVSDAAVWS